MEAHTFIFPSGDHSSAQPSTQPESLPQLVTFQPPDRRSPLVWAYPTRIPCIYLSMLLSDGLGHLWEMIDQQK